MDNISRGSGSGSQDDYRRVQEVKRWLRDCLTEQKWKAIFDAMINLAIEKGNPYAFKELRDTDIGRPLEQNMEQLIAEMKKGIEEMKRLRESAGMRAAG